MSSFTHENYRHSYHDNQCDFVRENQICRTLEEILIAWHYEELIPFIPQALKNHLLLSSPKLIKYDSGLTTALAKTGTHSDDYLMLVDSRQQKISPNAPLSTEQQIRGTNRHEFCLLKVHQHQLITPTTFPQLQADDAMFDYAIIIGCLYICVDY